MRAASAGERGATDDRAELLAQLAVARRELAQARELARHAHRDSARLVRLLTALSRPTTDTAALLGSALETVSEAFAADVVCLVRAAVPLSASSADHTVVASCGFAQGSPAQLPVLPGALAVTAHGRLQPGTCGSWHDGETPASAESLVVAGVAIGSGARLVLDPADAPAGELLVLRGLRTPFTATELKLLQSVTERLHSALQAAERRSAAEVLASAGARLTLHHDGAHLLAEAAELLAALTSAEWVGVAELEGDDVHLRAQTGSLGLDLAHQWPRRASALLGREDLRSGRSHLCPDLAGVPDHPDSPPRSGVRAVLSVPVVAEGSTQVLLHALHRTPSAFSRITVEAVEQLSSILSGALVSSRLHEALRASERSSRHRATHDALTGLANRALFREELELRLDRVPSAERGGGPDGTGLLFCDLDHFKAVNDELGHDAGDQLLRLVARRLQGAVRPGDLLARLGGDEFVVILDHVPDEVVLHGVAERLLAVLSAPFELTSHLGDVERVRVGGSVGGALAGREGSADHRAAELLRNADAAMYAAKRGGGRRAHTHAAAPA